MRFQTGCISHDRLSVGSLSRQAMQHSEELPHLRHG